MVKTIHLSSPQLKEVLRRKKTLIAGWQPLEPGEVRFQSRGDENLSVMGILTHIEQKTVDQLTPQEAAAAGYSSLAGLQVRLSELVGAVPCGKVTVARFALGEAASRIKRRNGNLAPAL